MSGPWATPSSSGVYRPIVQRWNGTGWRTVDFPSVHSEVGLLRGVQIDADGDPVVVGTRWDATEGHWRGPRCPPQRLRLVRHGLARRAAAGQSSAGWRRATDGSAWVVGASGSASFATSLCAEAQAATGIASVDPDRRLIPGRAPGSRRTSRAWHPRQRPSPARRHRRHPSPRPSALAAPTPSPRPTPRPTPRSHAARAGRGP